MKLYKNYEVISDGVQFIVNRIESVEKTDFNTKKHTGEFNNKITWTGYFGTLSAAIEASLNELIKQGIARSELNTLTDVINEIKKFKEQVRKAVE